MPGVLDLTWGPSASPWPVPGQSAMIYRGDTYSHELTFVDENGDPWTLTGTVTAQLKAARNSASGAGAVLESFACTVDGATVTIILTAAQTEDLPAEGVWDLQLDNDGTLTTLLTGRFMVWDDVTR